MKKLIVSLAVFFAFVENSFGAVCFRYYNKAGKAHTFKVKIDGVHKEITFNSVKTDSFTVHSGARECVMCTSCREVTIEGGWRLI